MRVISYFCDCNTINDNHMKKILILAIALATGLTACNNQSKNTAQQPAVKVEEQPVDTAFLNANAGEYRSYDGSQKIILGADGSVKCVKLNSNYTTWRLLEKDSTTAYIALSREGLDHPVTVSVAMDLKEKSIVVDNETYRKPTKPKKNTPAPPKGRK